MKHIKKLASLLLAVVMILALATTAFAASDKTITIGNAKKGHTYTAYQIFSGTVKDGELKNIQWGTGVTAAFINSRNAAEVASGLSSEADAKALAKSIVDTAGNLGTAAGHADASADGTVTISGLADGYYLVVDTATSGGTVGTVGDVYAEYIVKLAGASVNVEDKSDVPTVVKKVKDFDGNTESAWNDAADYNIGDSIPFQITGTLPSNYDSYTSYYYKFTDTATNLTIDTTSVKVMAGTANITSYATVNLNDGVLTVEFENLKAANGANVTDKTTNIVLTYNATLANTAVIGLDGNPNKVDLTYSNNPNNGGEGSTSKTPEDEVVIFTYELDVTKVDGANAANKLKDAQFILKAVDGKNAGKYVKLNSDGTVAGWLGTAPNAIDNPTSVTAAAAQGVLISGTDGLVQIIGLDAGNYELTEVKAPTGYNKLDNPISLEIIATQKNIDNYKETGGTATASDVLTALQIKVGNKTAGGNTSTGIVSTDVANNSGATLPSTGGIGTTIFYVTGAVLALGAGILLITKRRMNR